MLRLYSTNDGLVADRDGVFLLLPASVTLDQLFRQTDPESALLAALSGATPTSSPASGPVLAPVQSQEIWAAGVTYLRSRTARMEESKVAGGGSFYDRVYEAERPELFFKAT